MKSIRSVCLILLACLLMPAANAALPNIVFILADDLGAGDLGCYNKESKVPTPHMDKVAAAGVRFLDAHSPSSVCTPTRYGVLTGRYCWRTRLKSGVLWGEGTLLINPARLTVGKLLQGAGYTTATVGKWHLGFGAGKKADYSKPLTPGVNDVGFDYFFGIPSSLDIPPYLYVRNNLPVRPLSAKVAGSKHRRQKGGGFWRAGRVSDDFKHEEVLQRLADEAVAFIKRSAEAPSSKPFFLYFPLTAPHTPWLPPADFRGKSKAGYYGDFVAQVDDVVGQVAAALKESGQAGNTLLIMTSDNGSHWPVGDVKKYQHDANGNTRGQKADIWEGGHRVPFLASWPGKIRPGTSSDETICLTDFMATAAAIVDKKIPANAGEDSYNILPALLGKTLEKPIREATVHHSLSGMFSLRQGSWKLIIGRGSGGFTNPRRIKPKPGEPAGQLYNLADDPREAKNLYLEKPEVVARLKALLNKYKKDGRSAP
jgi:arylsulfatase A-like enzyme